MITKSKPDIKSNTQCKQSTGLEVDNSNFKAMSLGLGYDIYHSLKLIVSTSKSPKLDPNPSNSIICLLV